MTETNGSLWRKILIVLIPLLIAGVVAWITMRGDIRHLETSLDTKANRETVQAQFEAILRELQQINRRLDNLQR